MVPRVSPTRVLPRRRETTLAYVHGQPRAGGQFLQTNVARRRSLLLSCRCKEDRERRAAAVGCWLARPAVSFLSYAIQIFASRVGGRAVSFMQDEREPDGLIILRTALDFCLTYYLESCMRGIFTAIVLPSLFILQCRSGDITCPGTTYHVMLRNRCLQPPAIPYESIDPRRAEPCPPCSGRPEGKPV